MILTLSLTVPPTVLGFSRTIRLPLSHFFSATNHEFLIYKFSLCSFSQTNFPHFSPVKYSISMTDCQALEPSHALTRLSAVRLASGASNALSLSAPFWPYFCCCLPFFHLNILYSSVRSTICLMSYIPQYHVCIRRES